MATAISVIGLLVAAVIFVIAVWKGLGCFHIDHSGIVYHYFNKLDGLVGFPYFICIRLRWIYSE